MNYVDHLNLFGIEAKEIPCIKGQGAPTAATIGAVGLFYMDTDTGDVYKCTAVVGSAYTWEPLSSNSGGNMDLDTTLTQSGKAADAKAVGDKFAEITGISLVEPAEDDIPKIFFGGALQQTKDEAVVPFSYRSKTLSFDCYAEIKAQGNSTLQWPKKNQTVKLFKDAACTEKLKIEFKGWGKQNKFVIKANWRDLTHVRDIVSVRLEGDCMRTNPDYDELPELLKTSPNMGGIDGFPVLVYADGIYQGRYMWNIPKDKWMTNMDDELDEHCILCSEDYNSSCFRAAAKIDESDWTDEIHDTVPESIKTRWNEVISFVMNSTDEEFVANLDSYIKVSTLIDRHLMGLLSCDFDGYGKNQLYITYDGKLWYANRYDKDGTWGNYWTGSTMLSFDYGREQYEDMISDRPGNLLFIRLEQLFYERLQSRWAELRSSVLSIPNIINRFRELYDITPPHVIEEDYASTTANGAFIAIPNKTTCTIQQIQNFAVKRHAWMDEYIASLTPEIPVPCTGITLDKTALTFTAVGTQTLTATVTPDGCTDRITWESNNPSVATVSGGVVTAVANGSATITAKCGEYSANCSVSVSGIVQSIHCTGITLDKTELSFTEAGSQTIVATVTPADTTDPIVWRSENESVATVENGVVTPVFDGTANITAICGDYSAICVVTVSGVAEAPLYSLSETVFDGTNSIDTGITLFDEDKDFTFILDAQSSAESTWAVYAAVNWALRVWGEGASMGIAFGASNGYNKYLSGINGKRFKLVFIKKGDEYIRSVATDTDNYFDVIRCSFKQITSTLQIGSNLKGTVHSCVVLNSALDFVEAVGGLVTAVEDIVWSDTAAHSIITGEIVTGTNYITPDAIEVPDGVVAVRLYNVNDSTFTYQGVAQYDADMTFISFNEITGKSENTVSLDSNAKYVRFSAFPNGEETNIPATGLAAEFWTLQ